VDRAQAVAISPVDQKIVLAGFQRTGGKDDFAVVRLKTNGALDTSFNSTGKAAIALSTGADAASAVAVQADGKVVVAGYAIATNRDVAVARLQPNGALDTSFNSTGKNVFGVGAGNDEALAIALQSDGKVLVAGQAADGSQIDMMVARLGTDGTLDADFGSGGKVRIAFGSGNDYATGIALQPDGKILVGGYARIGTTYDFALARLLANGTLDPTFGGDGRVTTPIGTSAQANSVAVADGHVVLGGTAKVNGSDDFALARYGIDGTLDTFFGSDGIATTGFSGAADSGRTVALQQDRKIVLAGGTRASNDDNFAVTRWLVDDCGNGALDPGEECDGSMGENGDCCSACRLVTGGTTCRPVDDRCDLSEACDGLDGDCPLDARKPDTDGDGICNEFDLCPQEPDPDQADHDADRQVDHVTPHGEVAKFLEDAHGRVAPVQRGFVKRALPPVAGQSLRISRRLQIPAGTLKPRPRRRASHRARVPRPKRPGRCRDRRSRSARHAARSDGTADRRRRWAGHRSSLRRRRRTRRRPPACRGVRPVTAAGASARSGARVRGTGGATPPPAPAAAPPAAPR